MLVEKLCTHIKKLCTLFQKLCMLVQKLSMLVQKLCTLVQKLCMLALSVAGEKDMRQAAAENGCSANLYLISAICTFNFSARVQLQLHATHDTSSNWLCTFNFTPLQLHATHDTSSNTLQITEVQSTSDCAKYEVTVKHCKCKIALLIS